MDYCLQERAAGLRVVVADIDVIHHIKGGYGDEAAWKAAGLVLARKWPGFIRPPGVVWRARRPWTMMYSMADHSEQAGPDSPQDHGAPVDVSVIIVNWNRISCIGRCLDSIPEAAAGLSTEVIVVDNLSTDSSVDYVREHHPQARLIENPVNAGLCLGSQIGFEASRGEFVAILNPDVVLGPGSLAGLVDLLRTHPNAAQAGPKVVQPDGFVQSGPFALDSPSHSLRYVPGVARFLPTATYDHTRPQRCGRVSGACKVLRASMLRDIGGIPTLTFMYGIEQLLGYRFRRAGYEVWYDPRYVAFHEHAVSARQRWSSEQAGMELRKSQITAMRATLSYPGFLVYDGFLLLGLTLQLGSGALGRVRRPGLTLELIRSTLAALGPADSRRDLTSRLGESPG